MKLDFFNCPKPASFPQELSLAEPPNFITYEPNWELVSLAAEQFKDYQHILIIGHGGSITSLYGLYYAMHDRTKKKIYFLSTLDPDDIAELKAKLDSKTTLVVAISKSGETVTQLEAMMHFINYPLLVVAGQDTPLYEIGKRLKASIINYPAIGGRFTGLTEVALLPAAIAGLPVQEFFAGGQPLYKQFAGDNLAWKLASVIYQLESQGYSNVFIPIYSHYLFALSTLIVQLCHETFGKGGLGQTYFVHEAPESQHHTNQRFLGGRKNIIGCFISQDSYRHQTETIVPPSLHSVPIKNQHLHMLNKVPLGAAMQFELEGTLEDAKIKSIPVIHMSLPDRDPLVIGELIAFWQMYAIYSAILRDVNAFDQPAVENSKNISFNKRLGYKGLL
jgi:glucose-6-phosphate isomerase